MSKNLIPMQKVSEELGIHEFSIMKLMQKNEFPQPVEEDGRWKFDREEIDAYKKNTDYSIYKPVTILKDHSIVSTDAEEIFKKYEHLLAGDFEKREFMLLLETAAVQNIFGTRTINQDKDIYREAIDNKSLYWAHAVIREVRSTTGENRFDKTMLESLKNKISICTATINFGWFEKPNTFAVLFKGFNSEIIIDGTIQQFYELDKGLLVMERKYADYFYVNLKPISWEEIASWGDDSKYDAFIKKHYNESIVVETKNREGGN